MELNNENIERYQILNKENNKTNPISQNYDCHHFTIIKLSEWQKVRAHLPDGTNTTWLMQ